MNTNLWRLGTAAAAVILLATGLPLAIRAELPPDAYERMQADADEAIEVEITSVRTKAGGAEYSQVTTEAKVLGVQRSKSGLKKDESIVIEYDIFDVAKKKPGWAGPSSPTLVKKSGSYMAFLKATKGKPYAIAAMGRSFLAITVVKFAQSNGKVLSVADDSDESGTPIVVADSNSSLAQQWKVVNDGRFLKLVNRKSGKVLDVFEASMDEGVKIILWDEKHEDFDNQRWSWEGPETARRLKSKSSGLVLDVDSNGNVIQKKADGKAKNQTWSIKEVK